MNRDTLTIETARLLLRPTRSHDFEEFAAFLADAETMRRMGPPQSRSVAWRCERALSRRRRPRQLDRARD